MMEAATRLVAERALAVTLNGTPSNPTRASSAISSNAHDANVGAMKTTFCSFAAL
eukprot:COSAG02_NODE_12689_length_1509_cov_1.573759_4_plen_54_part_01